MMSDDGRNRSRRIWRWAAIALISVAVVLILVHVVILPAIVRNRFGALLREAGLEGVTFRVPLATASSARIVDVRVGDGAARIDRITVRYGVGGIRRGQLDALVIKGLLLRLQANLEKDPAVQQRLIKDATVLRDKAEDLRKKKTAGVGN